MRGGGWSVSTTTAGASAAPGQDQWTRSCSWTSCEGSSTIWGLRRLNSLALLAPAGMPSCGAVPRAASLLARLPGASLVLGLAVVAGFAQKRKYGGDWEMTLPGSDARLTEVHAIELSRLPVEGFKLPSAVGRTIASFPMAGLEEKARTFGRQGATSGKPGVPTFAVWGTLDSLVPARGLEELKATLTRSYLTSPRTSCRRPATAFQ
mmetsp:Transcript_118236/g.378897  ORF Transcript_118236/g.378897 Transcript_118236/m.378897 type:complete len:207 (+) Transcript_118236:474-1094(+)